MPFIPHTEKDVQEMLAAIGVSSIDALFDEIPAALRNEKLDKVPERMSEMEIGRLMRERASHDGHPLCFLGAGAYEHHIPAAVWEITTRGEYYSAYTPYQAEASQGTLQLIYEFQTMITRLTGMEVANASLYDGASGLAEAVLMAVRANRKSKSHRVLMPRSVHPAYRNVVHSLVKNQEIIKLILENSRKYTNDDLSKMALEDFIQGGKGRANAVLSVYKDELENFYRSIPINKRGGLLHYKEYQLEGNISALFEGISSYKYNCFTI